jgi:hypothetical protein
VVSYASLGSSRPNLSEDTPPEERYKMWYSKLVELNKPLTPYYATSPDGINWKSSKHNPALVPETDPDAWDQHIETAFVL